MNSRRICVALLLPLLQWVACTQKPDRSFGTVRTETLGFTDGSKQTIAAATANVFNVKSYGAIGDSTTDDAAAIQTAITAAGVHGGVVYFPPGSYLLKTHVYLNYSNVNLVGNAATLVSGLASNPPPRGPDASNTLLGGSGGQVVISAVPVGSVVAGSDTLTIPDASSVRTGDFVFISTSLEDTATAGYYQGYLGEVESVAGNRIKVLPRFLHSLNTTDDSVRVNIRRSLSHICIEGLTFRLIPNYRQSCIQLNWTDSLTIRDCRFFGGGQSLAAVKIIGNHSRFENNYINEFLDASMMYGYGIEGSGNDIVASENTIIRCKHGLTAGYNNATSTDILYKSNYVADPQGAGIDAHGSCEWVTFAHNTIVDVGKSDSSTSQGIYLRGRHFRAIGNTIRGVRGAVNGVAIEEIAVNDVTIADNNITSFLYGVHEQLDTTGNNITVSGNTFVNVLYGVLSHKIVNNFSIKNNHIEYTGYGVKTYAGENLDISNNTITGMSGTGYALMPGDLDPVSPTYRTARIADNVITVPSSMAGSQIRITNLYRYFGIINNHFDAGDSTSGLYWLSGKGNSSSVQELGNVNKRRAKASSVTTAVAAKVTCGVGDSIRVTLSGVTTSSVILVSYAADEPLSATDIAPAVGNLATGAFTVYGTNGKKVNYWIPKK